MVRGLAATHRGGMNYTPYPPPSHAAPERSPRRLVRSRSNKMVAGVCGGLAVYTGLDANLIRILLVAAVVFGFGTGIVLYVAAWLLMPEA